MVKRHGKKTINAIQPLPNVSVLVVDDNDLNRELTCDILGFFQIQVDGASSGKAAFSLVQKNTYDLIFMDHMMPVMDGVETMQKIRSLPNKHYGNIPIIALTANATKESQQMFMKEGFDDFLAKPIEMKKLQYLLEHWLRSINDSVDML